MSPEGLSQEDKYEKFFKGDKWILPTDIGLVGRIEQELLTKLTKDSLWTEDEVEAFVYGIFGEALINAIAHGNLDVIKTKSDDEPIDVLCKKKQDTFPELTKKPININITIEREKIVVSIHDAGKGFDYETFLSDINDPTSSDRLMDKMGRGIASYIKLSEDEVGYSDGGTTVTLTKTKTTNS